MVCVGLQVQNQPVIHFAGKELCRSVKWCIQGGDTTFPKNYCLPHSTKNKKKQKKYHNLLSYFVPSEAGNALCTFSTSIFVYLSAKLIKLPLPFFLCYHAYIVEKSKTPPHNQSWDFYCNQQIAYMYKKQS